MSIAEAKVLVAFWATNERLIQRIYFFGSRIRKENRSNSDLDIGVELIYKDPNFFAAHWAFESDSLTQHLSTTLPWKIDLQLFEPTSTPTIALGISRSSLLVYEKSV